MNRVLIWYWPLLIFVFVKNISFETIMGLLYAEREVLLFTHFQILKNYSFVSSWFDVTACITSFQFSMNANTTQILIAVNMNLEMLENGQNTRTFLSLVFYLFYRWRCKPYPAFTLQQITVIEFIYEQPPLVKQKKNIRHLIAYLCIECKRSDKKDSKKIVADKEGIRFHIFISDICCRVRLPLLFLFLFILLSSKKQKSKKYLTYTKTACNRVPQNKKRQRQQQQQHRVH